MHHISTMMSHHDEPLSARAQENTPVVHDSAAREEGDDAPTTEDEEGDEGYDEYDELDGLAQFLVTEDGEPIADVLASVRDELAMMNKILYRMVPKRAAGDSSSSKKKH